MVHIPVAAVPSCGERSPDTLAPCSPGPFSLSQTGTALQREVCHMLPLQLPCLNRVCHMVSVTSAFKKLARLLGQLIAWNMEFISSRSSFLEDDWGHRASVAVVILGGGCLGLKTHWLWNTNCAMLTHFYRPKRGASWLSNTG